MKKPFQKTQKLLDEIAAASGRMSTDSDYGVLFLGLILHQIYQKAKILGELATSFDNELISIPISGIEDNFAFFPINYPKYQKAFNLPQVPDLKWQVEGELLERFFKENEQFYENKRSLMIITMLRLSQEFADQLDKITDKNHLPFSASVIFLRAMMKLPDSPGDYHVDKLSIPFPVIIKPEERPSFIKKLNKEILDLLHEAFGILVVIAQIETFNFLPIFQGARFQADTIKIFLREDLCFPNAKFDAWLSRPWKVKYMARAILWKALKYSFCHMFLARFVNYVGLIAEIKAQQKKELIKAPLWTYEQYERWQKKSSHVDFDAAYESDEGEDDYNIQESNKDYLFRMAATLLDSGIYSDANTYRFEIIDKFGKMGNKLVFSYTLKGSPINFIGYVVRIIDNIACDILLKEYDKKVKNSLKISLKTLKRYEKEQIIEYGSKEGILEGKLYYSSVEVSKIKKDKLLKQKHKKEGFVTQRELIAIFRRHDFINRLQEKKIPLRKQSERIIRKKLELLRNNGDIVFEETANAILYKETEIINIAKELAKLQQSNQ